MQKRSGPINQKVHLRTRKQLQPFGTAQIDEGEERQAWLHSTKPLPVLRFTGSGGALICSSRFASAVTVPFFLLFPSSSRSFDKKYRVTPSLCFRFKRSRASGVAFDELRPAAGPSGRVRSGPRRARPLDERRGEGNVSRAEGRVSVPRATGRFYSSEVFSASPNGTPGMRCGLFVFAEMTAPFNSRGRLKSVNSSRFPSSALSVLRVVVLSQQ